LCPASLFSLIFDEPVALSFQVASQRDHFANSHSTERELLLVPG
jgi:hypothetical protein